MKARKKAQEDNLWVIVTIHNPSEFPCQVLNRDVWGDRGKFIGLTELDVKDMIKDNFVFCQVFLPLISSLAT